MAPPPKGWNRTDVVQPKSGASRRRNRQAGQGIADATSCHVKKIAGQASPASGDWK
jgi:hypothetical protein